MLRDLIQDLRYGWRGVRRSPGPAAIVVLSLALGIGASGALFSLANALFLAPLPVADPARLVLLSHPGVSGQVRRGPARSAQAVLAAALPARPSRGRGALFAGLAAQDSGSTPGRSSRGRAPRAAAGTLAPPAGR